MQEALRDRLVCGHSSEAIQKRLLAEAELTLDKAMSLAQGMEAADKNAKTLKGSETAIHAVQGQSGKGPPTGEPSKGPLCFRCGHGNHNPANCRLKSF